MSQEIEKPLTKKVKKLTNPRITPLEGEWHKSINQEYNMFNIVYDNKIINIFKTKKSWVPFFAHISQGSRLSKRDREIVILRIGWLCQSEYEWAQHVINAKNAGLTEEEIERITKGPNAEGWSEFERILIRSVDELHKNAYISDDTWKLLSEKYDTKKLMDVIFTVGQYNLVSMFLNSIGVQLEEGKKGFPE